MDSGDLAAGSSLVYHAADFKYLAINMKFGNVEADVGEVVTLSVIL
jgi:hypothetical protein